MTNETPCSAHPDRWFSKDPRKIEQAITTCGSCPMRDRCLRVALEFGETGDDTGIWGGTTPQARADMLQEQAASAEEDPSDEADYHLRGAA